MIFEYCKSITAWVHFTMRSQAYTVAFYPQKRLTIEYRERLLEWNRERGCALEVYDLALNC